jgi:hypothetical protein
MTIPLHAGSTPSQADLSRSTIATEKLKNRLETAVSFYIDIYLAPLNNRCRPYNRHNRKIPKNQYE